jgi:hypothetical protein
MTANDKTRTATPGVRRAAPPACGAFSASLRLPAFQPNPNTGPFSSPRGTRLFLFFLRKERQKRARIIRQSLSNEMHLK